jgi:hypothetical protein
MRKIGAAIAHVIDVKEAGTWNVNRVIFCATIAIDTWQISRRIQDP